MTDPQETQIEKPRWPLAEAQKLAEHLANLISPWCTRIEVAGSIRRRKPTVGDIELVYVPRFGPQAAGAELFADERTRSNLVDVIIGEAEAARVLERRKNAKGQTMFGPLNKLMRHVETGIPVDLFATTEECWFNYLVCRTGGTENNMAICLAAQRMGWKWTPYGPGFSDEIGKMCPVASERDVFAFVGLPYLEPEQRT